MKERSYRMEKVNSMLKKELADIIMEEIALSNDNLVTVNFVDTTADLSEAKVYISTLKNEEEILDALNKQSGHIRYLLGKRIRIKKTPKLIFKKDMEFLYKP